MNSIILCPTHILHILLLSSQVPYPQPRFPIPRSKPFNALLDTSNNARRIENRHNTLGLARLHARF
jgi:hypothetical protein